MVNNTDRHLPIWQQCIQIISSVASFKTDTCQCGNTIDINLPVWKQYRQIIAGMVTVRQILAKNVKFIALTNT